MCLLPLGPGPSRSCSAHPEAPCFALQGSGWKLDHKRHTDRPGGGCRERAAGLTQEKWKGEAETRLTGSGLQCGVEVDVLQINQLGVVVGEVNRKGRLVEQGDVSQVHCEHLDHLQTGGGDQPSQVHLRIMNVSLTVELVPYILWPECQKIVQREVRHESPQVPSEPGCGV